MQPTSDIDGCADGQHQHGGHQTKYDSDIALLIGPKVPQKGVWRQQLAYKCRLFLAEHGNHPPETYRHNVRQIIEAILPQYLSKRSVPFTRIRQLTN
jgi:hypothetical protein